MPSPLVEPGGRVVEAANHSIQQIERPSQSRPAAYASIIGLGLSPAAGRLTTFYPGGRPVSARMPSSWNAEPGGSSV
jgi:hypothetical protein